MAGANAPILRSLDEFTIQPLAPEVVLGVDGARVLYADHTLIRSDSGIDADGEEIEQWLLRETAFVSRVQAEQCVTNTPIGTTAAERIVHRPPRYCRAAVLETELGLLLDVKGCGMEPCDRPTLPNANGLLTISEAFYELAMQRLTLAALAHAGCSATTVPIYAIIDLGFRALFHGARPDERAVILVRRAQTRPEFQWGNADPGPAVARELMAIELTLRRYGITASSCGAVRFVLDRREDDAVVTRDGRVLSFPNGRIAEICARIGPRKTSVVIDGVNVQVSSGILESPPRTQILDFGRYRLRGRFENVLYSAWDRQYENLRGDFLLPEEADYVQPDARHSAADALEDETWAALQNAIGDGEAADRTLVNAKLDAFIARRPRALRDDASNRC